MGKLAIRQPGTWIPTARGWVGVNRWDILSYAVVLLAFGASYVGVLATKPLFVPDSQFYLGMAYLFSGLDMASATEHVKVATQAYGYGSGISQDVLFGSGVVQPRVVLPALAVPFIWIFGMKGLAVLTGLIAVALVVLLTKLLSNRYGRVPAVATMVLAGSSLFIVWFSTAMLTEALSAVWGALLLLLAWRYHQDPSRTQIVLLIVVTLLAGFTRQSTLIPAGAFAVAWLMSLVMRRPRKRDWGIPALAVCATTVIVQVVQSLSFSPVVLNDSREVRAAPTNLVETVVDIAHRTWLVLGQEFSSFAHFDHALLVLIGLSVLSMVIFWKHEESHLLLGAIIGIAIYNVGNGTSTSFRYAIPGLVFYLAAVALLFGQLGAAARFRLDKPSPFPS